ncbi:MAG: hypothetical protein ABFD49_03360 [Armatimonadota bacterium]|nr:hypothetical protein [bacterium]
MFDTLIRPKKILITTIATASVCAFLFSGCGNNSSDTGSATAPPPPSASAPKVAAAGPAISEKLSFDQLALESPVKTVTDKNGLTFMEFQYAGRDGKVYKCRLPKAMSEGQYEPDQWVRTFNIYKLPKVIKQKKIIKKNGQEVNDFPFIAPKPQQESTGASAQ